MKKIRYDLKNGSGRIIFDENNTVDDKIEKLKKLLEEIKNRYQNPDSEYKSPEFESALMTINNEFTKIEKYCTMKKLYDFYNEYLENVSNDLIDFCMNIGLSKVGYSLEALSVLDENTANENAEKNKYNVEKDEFNEAIKKIIKRLIDNNYLSERARSNIRR